MIKVRLKVLKNHQYKDEDFSAQAVIGLRTLTGMELQEARDLYYKIKNDHYYTHEFETPELDLRQLSEAFMKVHDNGFWILEVE